MRRRYWRNVLAAALLLGGSQLSASAATSAAATLPPPSLAAYGDLPGIEAMAISPDGRSLAIVSRIRGERMVVVLDGDRSIRNSVPLQEAKLRSIGWAGDDMLRIVISNTQALPYGFTAAQTELYGSILIPLDGGKPQRAFGKTQSLLGAVFGNYGGRRIDGRWVDYLGGVELARAIGSTAYVFEHGRPALFALDLQDNAPRKLAAAASQGHSRDWLVDAGGRVAATFDISSASGNWTITTANNVVVAQGIDKTGDVGLICLGKDGSTLIYSVEDDTAGKVRWFEVPLAGGAAMDFLPDLSIERLFIDQGSGHLLGYIEAGDDKRAVLFDPALQSRIRKVYRAFPKLHVDIVDWTPGFARALVRTGGNGDSGTWYLVDLEKLSAEPIGNERGAILPDLVGPISTVSYKAADGLEMDGILTLPPGREAKGLPVVMLPHGGPYAHDEATFDWWAQAFASRGYAVFQPNFRGSTNGSDSFRRAGYGQWGRKMQTDISDGLAELVRRGIVDPGRACIMGASYGGYAALAGVTLQHGLYRCAVAVAPVSDLSELDSTRFRESGDNRMVRASMRESLGDRALFGEVSPRRHAASADAPILLIHGKDDTVVAFGQSTAMADALKDAGRPYEMVVLRDEDHWLSRAATRQQMLSAAMAFVQKHNPAD